MKRIKTPLKARVGLYTTGHPMYWEQFDGIKDRVLEYGRFIEKKMTEICEVKYFGIVDTVDSGRRAGEYFNTENVDIIFLHSASYEMSSGVLPVHQRCNAPLVMLNLQPCSCINFSETSTAEWLSLDTSCSIPEFCNVLNRSGIKYSTVSGLLGMEDTLGCVSDCNTKGALQAEASWKEIGEYIDAAMVKRNIRESNMGMLGNFYCGMLDMYTDFTLCQAKLGAHIEIVEMSDLVRNLEKVTDAEVREKIKEINAFFEAGGDSASDPITLRTDDEVVEWAAKVACGQERMVQEYGLDAVAYYYHGFEDYFEKIQGGFIVGLSLLTAKGVPCAGEGDMKTAFVMRICDLLNKGGSFCEIVTTDYPKNAIIIGHDGPFHIGITDKKPVMRKMALYHGKRGSGISVEASVRPGPITTFALAQVAGGGLRFIAFEGNAYTDQMMAIGNTETHVDFGCDPIEFYQKWFDAAPAHHFALSVGHNISVFEKVAKLMDIEFLNIK